MDKRRKVEVLRVRVSKKEGSRRGLQSEVGATEGKKGVGVLEGLTRTWCGNPGSTNGTTSGFRGKGYTKVTTWVVGVLRPQNKKRTVHFFDSEFFGVVNHLLP